MLAPKALGGDDQAIMGCGNSSASGKEQLEPRWGRTG